MRFNIAVQTQLHLLFARLIDAREAVRAQTDVHPRRRQFRQRKRSPLEIRVRPRTMRHAHLVAPQQLAKDATQEDDTKKKQAKAPVLTRRVGRVTVILPKT